MVQKLHFCEKVYSDQLLYFQILLLLFLHTLLCARNQRNFISNQAGLTLPLSIVAFCY